MQAHTIFIANNAKSFTITKIIKIVKFPKQLLKVELRLKHVGKLYFWRSILTLKNVFFCTSKSPQNLGKQLSNSTSIYPTGPQKDPKGFYIYLNKNVAIYNFFSAYYSLIFKIHYNFLVKYLIIN